MPSIAFLVAIVSAVALVGLIVLFYVEGRREQRVILSSFREWCDGKLTSAHVRTVHVSVFGKGTLRATFHYFLHRVLAAALAVVSTLGNALKALQRSNKQAARAINVSVGAQHLTQLQQHKEATALSPAKRRKRLS